MLLLTLINIGVVATAVVLHFEFLNQLSQHLPTITLPHRVKILIGVFICLIAHAAEVWVFAFAYYALHHSHEFGQLLGQFDGSLLDCVYLSFTTFTTLGFGDITPIGGLRFLVGIESLTGLVLITWSASFLFLQMQRYWQKH
ncbi:potassium channel family protein [Alteromonadaceae bacterium BrNp21-10]|nr:potassium channel family protein [Alteromonadaceae bacterium BrNp21-10]